ncbi:hypothetical protein ADJ79_12770 [Ottowia sp. oral taxon 894]|uniref:tetratricopeptide repeat protein n=1 Tax=Ottowia sp. oral taxon 894 TaxID=1658672 RepID=UPI0006A28B42|nr:tetratricopeptide repeat protein [Ottowia sp. oral taxon 894]AKU68306.1 hypothetical protein ADJ79_12770 [Ottowia sp. oral taxon 894]
MPSLSFPPRFFHRPRRAAIALMALAALAGGAAHARQAAQAEPLPAQVTRLAQQGRTDEALAKAREYLEREPQDVQMRFIQSNLLAQSGRTDEAEAALVQLTRDYPELAEPYNNLAVLHAANGHLEKAREALETALRLDPGYATARENLGDVYLRLAASAYEQAAARPESAGEARQRLTDKAAAIGKLLR